MLGDRLLDSRNLGRDVRLDFRNPPARIVSELAQSLGQKIRALWSIEGKDFKDFQAQRMAGNAHAFGVLRHHHDDVALAQQTERICFGQLHDALPGIS